MTPPMMPTTDRPHYQFGQTSAVPKSALRFDASAIELGDNGESAKTAPVKMVARSGQPIEHWFWGKVVHDLSGMVLSKPRLPIDYAHDDCQVIGYLNKFDTTSGDLVVSGAIVPYEPDDDDMAAEVLYKSKLGVPYEASINFGGDGIQVQEVGDGEVTPVNGYQFEGPGIVIRRWPLRGVAICPYGADANTSTEFKESESFKFTTIKGPATPAAGKATAMSQQNTPVEAASPAAVEPSAPITTPAEAAPVPAQAVELGQPKPAEATAPVAAPAVDAPKTAPAATFSAADFGTAFGDVGFRWHHEGKSFAQCATEFAAKQKADHEAAVTKLAADHKAAADAKDAEIAELKTKLAAMPRGNEAAGFSAGDAKPDPKAAEFKDLSAKLGSDALALAAASVKFAVPNVKK